MTIHAVNPFKNVTWRSFMNGIGWDGVMLILFPTHVSLINIEIERELIRAQF